LSVLKQFSPVPYMSLNQRAVWCKRTEGRYIPKNRPYRKG